MTKRFSMKQAQQFFAGDGLVLDITEWGEMDKRDFPATKGVIITHVSIHVPGEKAEEGYSLKAYSRRQAIAFIKDKMALATSAQDMR